MQFFLTFLEGVISFISPCMLPLLPVYVTYFAAGNKEDKKGIFSRAFAFVLGFTLIFSLLGLFAGTIGVFLRRYSTAVNIVSGLIVIFFGLSYLEIIPLKFLKGIKGTHDAGNFISAFVFGMIYSVSLTPCVGAFLGSALMLAASSSGMLKGLLLLLTYSLGLGIPFILSAVLLERLGGAFRFIKSHYKVINTVCGVFLILVGAAMSLGLLGRLISFLSLRG